MRGVSSFSQVCVVGLGARTPIGLSAAESASSVRAGINLFAEHPFMVDRIGEPMVVSRAPYLPEGLRGTERLAELAGPTAEEALAPLGNLAHAFPVPLILGLPAPRPGLPARLAEELSARLRDSVAAAGRLADVAVVPCGHAAGLVAVEAACRRIEAGEIEVCLVGGVESYMESETLEWLDFSDRLHSRENRWSFTPGEAAGFCLLASAHTAQRHSIPVLAKVLAAATARETKLTGSGDVCTGEGLTAAFRGVLQALAGSGTRVDQVICDLNGERYRADEYGFTVARTASSFEDPTAFLAPADCWGDVGAASGPLFLMLAAISGLKGYAPGPRALLWAASESGERGAALALLSERAGS
jgi:3-oxoacyl-[acyl-carrier-protein] synthase-1